MAEVTSSKRAINLKGEMDQDINQNEKIIQMVVFAEVTSSKCKDDGAINSKDEMDQDINQNEICPDEARRIIIFIVRFKISVCILDFLSPDIYILAEVESLIILIIPKTLDPYISNSNPFGYSRVKKSGLRFLDGDPRYFDTIPRHKFSRLNFEQNGCSIPCFSLTQHCESFIDKEPNKIRQIIGPNGQVVDAVSGGVGY
ncbi:hypothetical protein Glove_170g43 [Diversispora epigaea]|uniref:Uncharacterized protein n=1 Tax=Diversispora epigaea TaxID=1348612 RepID=A0A397ISD3_9GLOM|nr:hypothetical protein Glove_170g43 [Diversispora epigaea]